MWTNVCSAQLVISVRQKNQINSLRLHSVIVGVCVCVWVCMLQTLKMDKPLIITIVITILNVNGY